MITSNTTINKLSRIWMHAGLTASLALCATATADAKLTRIGTSAVVFHATGPLGLKIEGKTSVLTLKDDGQTVTIVVPLANIDTGISLRNKHMREKYLETNKYPHAELQVSRAGLKLPGNGEAEGTFRLHGKQKKLKVKYTVIRDGSGFKVTGGLRINIKDYGIAEPAYLGARVRPDVDVDVSFNAKDT